MIPGEEAGRATHTVRLYHADVELLARRARSESTRRDRRVAIAEIVHEQLAQLRLDERTKGQGNG